MAFFVTSGTAWGDIRRVFGGTNKLVVAFLLLLSIVVYGSASRLLTQQTAISLPTVAAQSAAATVASPNSGGSAPTPQAPATTASVSTPEACQPATYSLPDALDVTSNTTGLTEHIEPVQYYTVHGATGAQVRRQIQQCAPRQNASDSVAEFTAQTGYFISWQYSYASRSDGTCVVTNAKVGLHVAMILPSLEPTAGASESFTTEWQKFATSLATHENGHVELDKQYARDMLTDLQNFPAGNCDTIRQSIDAIMQNGVVRLNIANERYDATTAHGASQGAILPQ